MDIQRARFLTNLEKLLLAHAPSGTEAEVDQLMEQHFDATGFKYWRDAADSIILHIPGASADNPIAVASHKDEIAMIVKRVEDGGKLRVQPIGGLWPWAIGEGPVEIIGRQQLIPGVFSVGSKHVSKESPAFALKESQALTWDTAWIETKRSVEELTQLGVRPGTKVVLARTRKQPWPLGEDYLCGYNLDCRAGLAILIETALQLKEKPPAQDTYIIATAEEEIGALGATFTAARLPAETFIAVDVAPVAAEYQTANSGAPVLGCKDARGLYNESIVHRMEDLARELGFGSQTAIFTSYGSDATIAKAAGSVGRAALIGYPGDNTHGYEICSIDAMLNSARLLTAYLWAPQA